MWLAKQARVDGLHGVEYMDSLQDKKRLSQDDAYVRFEAEVDRIYLQTPDMLEVRQPCFPRQDTPEHVPCAGLPGSVLPRPSEQRPLMQ